MQQAKQNSKRIYKRSQKIISASCQPYINLTGLQDIESSSSIRLFRYHLTFTSIQVINLLVLVLIIYFQSLRYQKSNSTIKKFLYTLTVYYQPFFYDLFILQSVFPVTSFDNSCSVSPSRYLKTLVNMSAYTKKIISFNRIY